MKKLLLLIILMFVSSIAFGVESFWCLNATTNVQSSGDHYRFNYSTVFDLSSAFTTNSGKPRYSDYASQSYPNNPLNSSRALATVGVAGCEHQIIYTINTNGGKFVSQSDPSKYCYFYVVNVPDFSYCTKNNNNTFSYDTGRYYYYYDSYSNNSSVAPSTSNYSSTTNNDDMYNNNITITVPKTNGATAVSDNNKSQSRISGNLFYSSIGLDLFLCLPELKDPDKAHLSYKDDYIATITVTWNCVEGDNCQGNHHGTFDIVVRGVYGSSVPANENQDKFILVVNPASDSTTLNLKDMIKNSETKTIASMTIATTTKEGSSGSAFAWRDHIYAFLSASPNYSVSDQNGFLLTKVDNHSITIPYKILVSNTTGGGSSVIQEFDGKGYYDTSDLEKRLDLYDYSKTSTDGYAMSYDRYGTYYYAINYTGTVNLQIENFPIPGSSNYISTVMNDPVTYKSDYSKYIGKYESNIYYHIVYSDVALTN